MSVLFATSILNDNDSYSTMLLVLLNYNLKERKISPCRNIRTVPALDPEEVQLPSNSNIQASLELLTLPSSAFGVEP